MKPGPMKAAVLAAFPGLSGQRVFIRNSGMDCIALDVGDRMIFKFPRNPLAEGRLRREAGLLAAIRPRVPLAVPRMVLHHGPPVFSSHRKLPGKPLEPAQYARLDDGARGKLARDLARFFAALHALDVDEMIAVGAVPILPGADAEAALPFLPRELYPIAKALTLVPPPPDPYGDVFGFFDGHGLNMAFDRDRCVLNGIFDFADSGIGPLHQEFVAPGHIGADLVRRILADYGRRTNRPPDPDRVRRLTGLHRLQEIAGTEDPGLRPKMIASFADWFARK